MFRPSERLSHRIGLRWGKAEFAADIRVLDGQRFLEVLPLTHSVASEELAIAELQPVVWNSDSSMTSPLP